MPRYFFDIKGFHYERDEEGVVCADLQAAVREAKKILLVIASDEIRRDGEHYAATVLITDEDGQPIYCSALSYVGTWLIR